MGTCTYSGTLYSPAAIAEKTAQAGNGKHSLGHIAELDGLRGMAIFLVILHHVYTHWPDTLGPFRNLAAYGWIGVDIFFVLSGFLITSILLKVQPSLNSLKDFYIKRALRIWPLYYVLLIVVSLEAYILHKSYPWKVSLILFQNFLPAWPNLGFNQTWSLCIEEHFYLVWPLLIFVVPRRVLSWILGVILLTAPLLRFWAITHGVSTKLLYTSTYYRLDAIALGSLLALFYGRRPANRRFLANTGLVLLPVALSAAIVELYLNPGDLGQRSASLYTLLAFLSAAILCIALNPAKNAFSTVLRWGTVRYVGKISYGLYMIHPFVFGIIHQSRLRPVPAMVLAISASLGAAALSWHVVESQLLRLKQKLASPKEVRSDTVFETVSTGR